MANLTLLESFIEKVIKEANEAAQAVYDKHQEELIKRIQGCLSKDHEMINSMGMCSTENTKTGETVNENLSSLVSKLSYPKYLADSCPQLPYKITKTNTY